MDYAALLAALPTHAGVATDTRDVRPGTVFVAGGGPVGTQDTFVREAEARGASVIVGAPALRAAATVPFVEVADFREAAADLAAAFHGDPSRTMLVVGITGTCGKTTTTYLVEAILRATGRLVGSIGTVSYRFPGHERPATNTTPGAVELQCLLAEMRDAG